jgi:hypothetical protein
MSKTNYIIQISYGSKDEDYYVYFDCDEYIECLDIMQQAFREKSIFIFQNLGIDLKNALSFQIHEEQE